MTSPIHDSTTESAPREEPATRLTDAELDAINGTGGPRQGFDIKKDINDFLRPVELAIRNNGGSITKYP
ncbi:hypothetical protein [Methylobacterium oryzihabitans]|uniref:Uncharacterized protein n=1 Tax=Methylobacterium oryzihabitans TaxID=2499852 RepID=A0A3S2YN65_9HYPH|nr:hypothetical protein [Methylobacterium oryzihabitans]RVU14976.1 hypothetical protein EOE48_21380 [Methylobacterium oryzihabitans]